jgi:hypothetical protein
LFRVSLLNDYNFFGYAFKFEEFFYLSINFFYLLYGWTLFYENKTKIIFRWYF